jgi:multidrug resistance efflux pump
MTEEPREKPAETTTAPGDDDAKNPDSAPAKAAAPAKDPIRKITRIVLAVCVLFFIWYVLADRLTPFTDQARVHALVTPIVPQVSGYLTEVNVRLHSIVEDNELMFQIDRRLYVLAVRSAEANLDLTAQTVGAQTATVKTATAQVGMARAQLDRAQRNFNRTRDILDINPGALSQADKDRAETSLDQAIERVASAEAELQRAKEQLGVEGPENPQLRAAVAALEQAQLNLAFSSLRATGRGAIESFNVDLGFYAQAGQPLATFVANHGMWIQADMRENNISNIEVGDPVEFVLDVAPGRIFSGKVRSVGYGVGTSDKIDRGNLPTVSGQQGWLREPQRFPVIVAFDPGETVGLLRSGGQVDVTVYTGGRPILNAIAKLRLRLRSLTSYVR